jgi:1-acyl-sn-glycerol-3-phosphate acyltransferase
LNHYTMSHVMDIGARVPRWHNRFLRMVGGSVLALMGWRLDMHFPDEPKLMVIAAPHTSNWDLVVGIAAILYLQINLRWYAKHTIFTGVWNHFFRALGGFPVDRTAPGGIVAQTAAAYAAAPQMMIAVTPEGTRSLREHWKRGFYHIALRAQVPVLIGFIDWRTKVVGTTTIFRPTGDWDADMKPVFDFYRTITPKKPENFMVEEAPAQGGGVAVSRE